MLRARRALATAASGSSAAPAQPLRLVRRLHHRTVASSAPLLAASAPVSRFSAGGATRAFVTLQRRRSALSPAVSTMQLRWRSALSDEQHGKLAQHMAELAACRDNGNWRQALKLLDRIDKEGFALDAEMYELAMAACARMGKIEVLPGLLQNMEVDALLPTNRTIDFVMQAYIAAEEWKLIVKLAKEVTAKGVPLSDAAFQAAFESCGKMRDATSARQILLNAEAAGSLELDASHYAAAIRACGMGGRADLAAGLFAHMEEKRGIEADADVFNHLIRAQIVNGALPQALQTFTTVNERPEIEMPESIYTATIDALVSEGEFWQATQLFGQMVAHDLSPSVFCYGRMMVAYVRLNKHELARECWQRVLAINEPSPSLTKYAKMVTQLSTTNDSELATAIFEHIFPLYDPAYIRDTTYAAAIRAYGRLGRTQTAVDLFDTFVANRRRVGKPLPRSAGIYLAVFNALSRDSEREPKQNSRDAQRVWDIMVESVPVVMAPAYASLAGVFASSGDLSTLDELMEHAEESMKQQAYSARRGGGRQSHYNNYSAFDEMEQDHDDEVFDGEDEAAFDGEIVGGAAGWRDELLYNGVISGFSKARSDQSQRVMDYLETMRARGMTITDSVVRASTDTFVKHAQWGHMFELMDFVDERALQNADVCFGDTISKLLEAQAWETARFWIARAHHLGLQPPIRGKMEVLRTLREDGSHEWQIAYALARETLSFKQMVQDNIESVADAVDVCARAGRTDLVVKLFERTASHASLARRGAERGLKLPLRMYKQTLLACMREHSTTPDFGDQDPDGPDAGATPIQKAEAICAQMLQAHAAKASSVSSDEALDGAALSLAISIKATMGDDDDVLALFEKMQQHGFAPNSYAYNAAIIAYSRAKRIDRVLAVRDALLENDVAILREPKVTQSLLFSLAILHDDAAQREHLASTRALLPHVATDDVVAAFLQAKRLDKCVEYYDETTSSELFYATLRRLLDGPRGHHKASASASSPSHAAAAASQGDAARLGAALLLKHIAFHGLDCVKPPGLVLRVAKKLVQAGALREAHAILSLFSAPGSELALADMKPAFQKDALELLLFIHGEQRSFNALGDLFDKQAKGASAVPLHVRHYQLAMEYCVPARDALAPPESGKKITKKQKEEIVAQGATACLKLFETLRMQFVKPNGAVYALALQSCHRLGRLDVTGARVLGDAVDQGFGYLLASELYRLASTAVHERRIASEAALTGYETTAPRRGRKASKPASAPKVDVAELAAVALFAHHGGVPISWRLGKKLLELGAALPKNVRNELKYIVEAAEAAYAARTAEMAGADGRDQTLTATASAKTATRAARAAQPAPRKATGASTAKAGARWGELYLQKLPSDE